MRRRMVRGMTSAHPVGGGPVTAPHPASPRPALRFPLDAAPDMVEPLDGVVDDEGVLHVMPDPPVLGVYVVTAPDRGPVLSHGLSLIHI